MSKRFDRTIGLIGESALDRLRRSSVLVVGLGGVGGAAFETLVRSGIGSFTVVDGDTFEPSNLNRQILCTEEVIGELKTKAAVMRAHAIDSETHVTAVSEFLNDTNCERIVGGGSFDYIVDAIDDIKAKSALVICAQSFAIPIISAMGAGNRTDCDFKIVDLFDTEYDPFARAFRKAMRGKIDSLKTVCAASPPTVKEQVPCSIAAPPFAMGAIMASHVVKYLTESIIQKSHI